MELIFGDITSNLQQVITAGFQQDSHDKSAPEYKKERLNWLEYDQNRILIGALTADLLWDWMYIDELWTAVEVRGKGVGRKLMQTAEEHAMNLRLSGLWLWTQSWQAREFYMNLGYVEFTRFTNFPKGYERIGLRKTLNKMID